MYKKLFYRLFILLFVLSGCKQTTEPIPPKTNHPGYQEDIPWASLEQSPWPMSLQNPQSTGRSNLLGPTRGVVEWEVDSLFALVSGIVQSSDSTIYVAAKDSLFAFKPDGKLKWSFGLGTPVKIITTPILASDGTIYVSGGDNSTNKIYAIKNGGTLKWTYEIAPFTVINQSSLVIGINGNLFFADFNRNIYCLNNKGEINWENNFPALNSSSFSQFSFSPDGTSLYAQGFDVNIIAINAADGSLLWSYGDSRVNVSPIVDNTGNLYFVTTPISAGKSKLISLKNDGSVNWEFNVNYKNHSLEYNQPCLDYFGNIYVGSDTLYSVNYLGQLNWKFGFSNASIATPILCDVANNIYFGVGFADGTGFMSFDNLGKQRWEFSFDNSSPQALGGSPAIGYNGNIYCPTWEIGNKVFSIE